MTLAHAYFDIVTKGRDGDGHLRVTGKATDSSLDIDAQRCDDTWLRSAMPDWFKWGNVREQHSSIAAGVATDYEARDDGHYIEVKVVDPGSAKKVEEGVLKGFSVGIKNPRIAKDATAKGGRIIGGEIVEVSLVDRPANENCKLVLAKAADAFAGLVATEELVETPAALAEAAEPAPTAKLAGLLAVAVADECKTPADIDLIKRTLGKLFVEEGTEQAAGEDEEWSLRSLLDALSAIKSYEAIETAEGEPAGGVSPAALSDQLHDQPNPGEQVNPVLTYAAHAALVKRVDAMEKRSVDGAATVSDETTDKSDAAPDEKLASVEKALAELGERIEKVERQPAAGGPVRAIDKTPANGRSEVAEQIRYFRQQAAAFPGQQVADGYLAMADKLEATLVTTPG